MLLAIYGRTKRIIETASPFKYNYICRYNIWEVNISKESSLGKKLVVLTESLRIHMWL